MNLAFSPATRSEGFPVVEDAEAKAARTVVNAPSDLAATATSGDRMELSWRDNSSNETSFTLERRKWLNGPWEHISSSATNVTSYTDRSVVGGITYLAPLPKV